MDSVADIVGIAARFLMAAGIPPVAVYAAIIVLAILIILAPGAARVVWESIRNAKVPPDPMRPGDSPSIPNDTPGNQPGPPDAT